MGFLLTLKNTTEFSCVCALAQQSSTFILLAIPKLTVCGNLGSGKISFKR